MSDDHLNSILGDLAENAKPTAQIDLWPGLTKSLAARARTANMEQTSVFWRATFAALVLVVLFGLAFLTPQGRAFAQKIFRFFTISEGKSFPIPTEQVFPVPATVTPAPRYSLLLKPVETMAEPTKPTELPERICTSPEAQANYFCQVKAAETQAGFDVMEFPADPKGMKFSKITFDPGRQIFETEFVVASGGGYLYLRQGNGDFPSGNGWDKVPAEAIEQVTVGENYAELVSGGFMIYPEATEAVWEPGGALRLRWYDGERWFSLEKMGDPYPIEWLDENQIIKLAESLVVERPLNEIPPVDPEYLPSVEFAEKLAGFDVLAPTLLPQGYELKRVVWADETVRLLFGPKNSQDSRLFIFMGPITNSRVGPCLQCPPGAEEVVQVGPWQGWYLRGIFDYGQPVEGQPTPTPVWQAEARHWQLVWNTEQLWILMFFSPWDDGMEMNKETLLAIAESLK
jgi:hypothetical protein